MKRFSPGTALMMLVFSLTVILPFAFDESGGAGTYAFEVTMRSTGAGYAQLYYDTGEGFSEQASVRAALRPGTQAKYRFELRSATYRNLRFDPTDREGEVTILAARIVQGDDRTLLTLRPDQFQAANHLAASAIGNGAVRFTTLPGATDPITQITGQAPFTLRLAFGERLLRFLPWCIVAVLLAWLAGVASRLPQLARAAGWFGRHPHSAIFAAAALGVAIQMHPVIFLGRSLVSPDNGPVLMLYEDYPTLPSYRDPQPDNGHGADVGALMWQHVPFTMVQREAVFRDHALPLWNRYDLSGSPLLGQGQSMFGDPLQWIPILGRSASWTWDVKFILARWLFAAALGLAAWRLGAGLTGALVAALTSAFAGFFAFRYNHPAIFSVCYAPWILVAWSGIASAGTRRALGGWLGLLLLSNWMTMNSGTIKEAYMLIAGMNLSGLLVLIFSSQPGGVRLRKLLAALAAGLVFVLLSAPGWISFLVTLRHSYTTYDVPGASQVPPWEFIGFFDDLFYRQLRPQEATFLPSANFLVLLGLGWGFVRFDVLARDRTWRALALSACLPLALIFGLIPASVLVRIPFIANISHIDNTFSCVLLVQAVVLAAFGWTRFLQDLGQPGWEKHLGHFTIGLGLVLWFYFGSVQGIAKSGFFTGYALTLILAVTLFPWLAGRARAAGQSGAMALAIVGLLTLWRHAEYRRALFDDYVVNPGQRVDLRPDSPALDYVRNHQPEPARVLGLGQNFFPGYGQLTGIETIYGADALRNRPYHELAQAFGLERVMQWAVPDEPASDGGVPRARDLLNVRYYLGAHSGTARSLPGFNLRGEFDLDVYERPSAWPRAFFTDAVLPYNTAPEFAQRLLAGDGQPIAAVLPQDFGKIGSVPHLVNAAARRGVRAARDYALTSNSTAFTVEAGGPGIVVLAEAYYQDDFIALVDGRPVPYFRVNHAFKGLHLETAGVHRVTFRYWPQYFTLSLWLAAGGLVLLCLLAVGIFRRSGAVRSPGV